MSDVNIAIRKMSVADIPAGMGLSMAENWNQTPTDWEILIKGKNNISLVAECDGKVVATTTAINYSHKVAWIGMVLVNREYRGLGISKQLLQQTLILLEGCPSIKLDATPAGQPVYKKIGFLDEYNIYRMTRMPGTEKKFVPELSLEPVPLHRDFEEDMVTMDEEVFGANRGILVRELFKNSPERAWMVKSGNKLAGFCLSRPGSRYTQIGPVCARNTDMAKSLISAAFSGLDDQPVVIDIPESHHDLLDWFVSQGFVSQRPFTRMYLDNNPYPGIPEHQFLICGPEMG